MTAAVIGYKARNEQASKLADQLVHMVKQTFQHVVALTAYGGVVD